MARTETDREISSYDKNISKFFKKIFFWHILKSVPSLFFRLISFQLTSPSRKTFGHIYILEFWIWAKKIDTEKVMTKTLTQCHWLFWNQFPAIFTASNITLQVDLQEIPALRITYLENSSFLICTCPVLFYKHQLAFQLYESKGTTHYCQVNIKRSKT